ncbi:MAG TPA: glycosyltransferase [Polyangiaceae bacterium]|nr:glycosyltransferase [Polyangiaceae bacterium]
MSVARPLVSIHVITYNHENFIGPALQSALDQDYPNLEIVVADDESKDGTRDVVADFARRHPDRVVAILEPHAGITGNYNRALLRCTGKYVAILNGDDMYLPGKISAQVAWLEAREQRTLCAHDVEHFDSSSGAALKLHSQLSAMRAGAGAADFIYRGCPFASVSVMVRRSVLPPAGMSTRLRTVLDWKFSIDALVSGGEFGYVDGVLARYRVHPSNVINTHSEDMWLDVMTTLSLLEAEHPQLARVVRRGRARSMYRRGIRRLQAGDGAGARAWLEAAAAEDLGAVPKLPAWYLFARLPEAWRQRLSKLR